MSLQIKVYTRTVAANKKFNVSFRFYDRLSVQYDRFHTVLA